MIPPQYVKPFVKTNKNDATDAEAICEAAMRGHCGAFGIVTSVGACNIGKLIDIIEDHEDKPIPELARSEMRNASAFD